MSTEIVHLTLKRRSLKPVNKSGPGIRRTARARATSRVEHGSRVDPDRESRRLDWRRDVSLETSVFAQFDSGS